MPLSPFVPGIYIWTALEGLVGISPYPTALRVDPVLPRGWDWMAVSNLPYRGNPLTILVDGKNHILYTTAPVESAWKHKVVPESLQKKFIFVSEKPAFELMVSKDGHLEVLAASAEAVTAKVVDRETRRVIRQFSISAGNLVEVGLQ
ncbi:MAG TPA: glycosyl hydrolase family 65 protein [Terriglobia bacterium]|nr:glycosyl hydrolase family 65 protein [Terriglobia bacterium]